MKDSNSALGPLFSLLRLGEQLRCIYLDTSETMPPTEVSESDRIGFSVSPREIGVEYEIRIGDVFRVNDELISTHANRTTEGGASVDRHRGEGAGSGVEWVLWKDGSPFESAVGPVHVQLRSRISGVMAAGWTTRAVMQVNVLPGKIGAEKYSLLLDDLARLSGSLVVDLHGMSSASVSAVRQRRGAVLWSSQVELRLLEGILDRLATSLDAIQYDPTTTLVTSRLRSSCWGTERLSPRSIRQLTAKGVDPRHPKSLRPFTTLVERLTETTNTVENRKVKAFVLELRRRAEACGASARKQLLEERSLGLFAAVHSQHAGDSGTFAADAGSGYAAARFGRLMRASQGAARLAERLRKIEKTPLLRSISPLSGSMRSPVFTNLPSYRAIATEAHMLRRCTVNIREGLASERLQSTARLYEWWVWLQMVGAFCNVGLKVKEQDVQGAINEQFTHTLSPGATIKFAPLDGLTVTVEYEPTLGSKALAIKDVRPLYSATGSKLRPDTLITITQEAPGIEGRLHPSVVAAFIVDAKYTNRPRRHFKKASKYLEICATLQGDQPIVPVAFLAYPGRPSGHGNNFPIELELGSLKWSEAGLHLRSGRATSDRSVGYVELAPSAQSDHTEDFDVLPIATPAAIEIATGILAMCRKSSDRIAPLGSDLEQLHDEFPDQEKEGA